MWIGNTDLQLRTDSKYLLITAGETVFFDTKEQVRDDLHKTANTEYRAMVDRWLETSDPHAIIDNDIWVALDRVKP